MALAVATYTEHSSQRLFRHAYSTVAGQVAEVMGHVDECAWRKEVCVGLYHTYMYFGVALFMRASALGPLCDYAIILQAKGPADLRRDRPSGYNQVGPGPLPLTRVDCCLLLHLQGN